MDNSKDALSIAEFCHSVGISQSFFFKQARLGLMPRSMKVGSRVLISREAAADWRLEREQAAAVEKEAA